MEGEKARGRVKENGRGFEKGKEWRPKVNRANYFSVNDVYAIKCSSKWK